MTIKDHARIVCEHLVQGYIENGSCSDDFPFWDVIRVIKHSYELELISRFDAERYCYHMHITFDEMLKADETT